MEKSLGKVLQVLQRVEKEDRRPNRIDWLVPKRLALESY